MRKPIPGDLFITTELPEPPAYIHYLLWDESEHGLGCLVHVYRDLAIDENPCETILNHTPMFSPIFLGLFAAIREGYLRRIGHIPIQSFKYPVFRYSPLAEAGKAHPKWHLWDGKKLRSIGKLPPDLRHLECLACYNYAALHHRLVTEENPNLDYF